MNVIFDPKLGKLYDFIYIAICYKKVDKYLDVFKSKGITHIKELEDALHYIWDGLDVDIPGIDALVYKNEIMDIYLFDSFIHYVWEWKTTDVFIENFDRLIHTSMRYDILSFFDEEEHQQEYYRIIADNTVSLHEFVSKLKVPDRIKLGLIGIASGSEKYAFSLKALFKTLAERLDRVYEKNAEIIRAYSEKMRTQLNSSDEFFMMKTTEFKTGYDKHKYENARVVMSFINPTNVFCIRTGRDVDIYLGMENKYQRTYENGTMQKYSVFFKALSDDSRIRIIELLREREMFIGEIAKALNIPLTTLSYHIKMLNEADIIQLREEGKKTFCSFESTVFNNSIYVLGTIAGLPRKII